MPDVADIAQERMEHDAEHAVAASKRPTAASLALKITGLCHYCGEATPAGNLIEGQAPQPPRRWCDAVCRDAWQREQRVR